MREDFDSINHDNSGKVTLNKNGLFINSNSLDKICDSSGKTVFIAINLGNDIFNLVAENFMGLLYVSEELIDLANRNFIFPEEKRFKKQQLATWISIGLAFITGMWSIFYQIVDSSNNKKESACVWCCTAFISRPWSILSKNPLMSRSITQS